MFTLSLTLYIWVPGSLGKLMKFGEIVGNGNFFSSLFICLAPRFYKSKFSMPFGSIFGSFSVYWNKVNIQNVHYLRAIIQLADTIIPLLKREYSHLFYTSGILEKFSCQLYAAIFPPFILLSFFGNLVPV